MPHADTSESPPYPRQGSDGATLRARREGRSLSLRSREQEHGGGAPMTVHVLLFPYLFREHGNNHLFPSLTREHRCEDSCSRVPGGFLFPTFLFPPRSEVAE